MARRSKNNVVGIIVSLCLVLLLSASLLSAFGKVSDGGETSSDISLNSSYVSMEFVEKPYSKQSYDDFQKDVFSQDLSSFYVTSNFSGDYNHSSVSSSVPYYCDGCYCPYSMARSMAKVVSIETLCAYFEFEFTHNVPGGVKFFTENADGEKAEVYSFVHSGENNIIQSPELRVYFGDYYVDFIFNYYYGHFYYGFIFDYCAFGDAVFDETEEGIKNFEENFIIPALREIVSDGLIQIEANVVVRGLGVEYHDHIER